MSGEGSALYRANAAAERLILDARPNLDRTFVSIRAGELVNDILRIDSLLVSGQIDRDMAWKSFNAAADRVASRW